MREHERGHPTGVIGLTAREPPNLRDREGCHGHTAHRLRPRGGAAQLIDESLGIGRRAGVVPQQRGSDHLTSLVEHHHPVLLARDRHRLHALE